MIKQKNQTELKKKLFSHRHLFESFERFQTVFDDRTNDPVRREKANVQPLTLLIVRSTLRDEQLITENDDLVFISDLLSDVIGDFASADADQVTKLSVTHRVLAVLRAFDDESEVPEEFVVRRGETRALGAAVSRVLRVVAADFEGDFVDQPIVLQTIENPVERNAVTMMGDAFDQSQS